MAQHNMKLQTCLLLPVAVLATTLALPGAETATNSIQLVPAGKRGATMQYPSFGSVERLNPQMDKLVPKGATLEKLAEGFKWSEGPVWLGDRLVFSDVPANIVYQWQPLGGLSVFLQPSGFTGAAGRNGESGSNGLGRDAQGKLLLCQHGDRRVARLNARGQFESVAEFYKWYRFNSPNDLAVKRNGDIYFTDPPYGLEKGADDSKRELPFYGVFRVNPKGIVTLLTNELTRPNGIAFSPDEKTLYVANSDPLKPLWMAYPVLPDGTLGAGRVFFDAAKLAQERKGGCDGLKVDKAGNLFATGPGGILVISPQGQHLGTIMTGVPTANCAWGGDGKTLYITANHWLCRITTSTQGKP